MQSQHGKRNMRPRAAWQLALRPRVLSQPEVAATTEGQQVQQAVVNSHASHVQEQQGLYSTQMAVARTVADDLASRGPITESRTSDHGLPAPISDARLHTLDESPMSEFIMGSPSSPHCFSPLLTPIQEHTIVDTPPSGNASSGIQHSPCVPSDVVEGDDHGQAPHQMTPEAEPQGETEEGPLPVETPVISVPPQRFQRQRKPPQPTMAIRQALNSSIEVMKCMEADCKCEHNARCTWNRLDTKAKGQMSRHCRQRRCH